MPSFLTQCPHCLTSFRVTDSQLEAAEGLVRCGACLGIFSAAANRITLKQSPEEAAAAAAEEAELSEFDYDEDLPELDGEEPDRDDIAAYAPAEFVLPADTGLDDEEDFEEEEEEGEEEEEEEEEESAEEDADEHQANTAPIAAYTARDPDADLLDPEDFDIPLGDLKLDDETDADTEDRYEDDDAEYEDEDEEAAEIFEDDELESEDVDATDETDEDDDFADEDEAEEVLVEVEEEYEDELLDAVYEEYTDAEATTPPASVSDEEPEQSEEFVPDIDFADDELLTEAGESFAATDRTERAVDDYAHDSDGDERQNDDDENDEDDDELDQDADDLDENDDEADETDNERRPPPAPTFAQAPFGARANTDKAALRRYLADIEDDDALDPLDDEALDALDEPVMLDTAPRRSWLIGAALLLANVLLVCVLGWQYLAANIGTLSRSSGFSALMPLACRVVECPPPERSQVDRFVSEQLLVRSHPRYAEALEVSLVFRNDASEAQPFPAIELGFHDTANRLVANRLFMPADYLPMELDTSEMPAQSSLQVTLELVDPGSEAVNYTLTFREP